MQSARSQGLAQCQHCHWVQAISKTNCERCHLTIEVRIKHSEQRCWAFLLTAFVFMFPANLLPITILSSIGAPQPETIISGVFSLIDSDMEIIAVIVFVASIVVPAIKIIGLALILISLQLRLHLNNSQRIFIYRFVDVIGKWSMIDLFVLSIMVAVFQYNDLVGVVAGFGATAFTAVVLLTIAAAKSFDTRLIWDKCLD
ncbi:paraquat-inducible membrane protein A [Alginatibacterium sediminis]|uniref:Paraquat-inducible membrane protein A n=1 Tax=Alginatibacterium sediminis TaxID=2164068 RepID=A0A420EHE9_9ALTE|nr:paraquat-inducible protein A [Alginatibacterium sediminis]RKF20119.1 paraquat-inducible membrane protein A [Alginatibacterium sediminis]